MERRCVLDLEVSMRCGDNVCFKCEGEYEAWKEGVC
jgi:hypothetical protein